jgi:hypothetical protein
LRRAYVARRTLTANVLFACLERHSQRAIALGVDAHADDSSWKLANARVSACEECRVRPTVSEWHAESLSASDRYVCSEFAWRRDEGKCQQITRDGDERPFDVCSLDEWPHVMESTVGSGNLKNNPEKVFGRLPPLRIPDHDIKAERSSAS